MRIWLDISPHSHARDNDCNRDCGDCRVSAPLPDIIWPPAEDIAIPLHTLLLEQATPIHMQSCGDEKWLLCTPTGPGRIAVFGAEALSLFSLFSTPTTISQALEKTPAAWPREGLEDILTLFYQSGFLRARGRTAPTLEQTALQTLTAWLHVTNECNLRCAYCYIDKTPQHMPPSIGRQSIDAIFRSVLKHNKRQVRLKFAGGEASLQVMQVLALYDYVLQLAQEHDIALKAVILTNGVSLSQRIIERLKARQIAVTISLDGLGSFHDSQRPMVNGRNSCTHILRTIDRLLTNEVVPSITVTVSGRNLVGLPDLMRYILQRDLPFSLNYYRDNDCSAHITDPRFMDEQIIAAMSSVFAVIEEHLPARSLLDSLLDKASISTPHTHTCGVGQNYLVIDQHGGVAKCQMEIKHTVTTIQSHDPLRVIQMDRRGVQGLAVAEKQGCRSCEWRNWCTGGCPALTYRSTGRHDVKSPNCHIYKALFPKVLRLEALRLLRYCTPITISYAFQAVEHGASRLRC
jgi:uncharacterized protein